MDRKLRLYKPVNVEDALGGSAWKYEPFGCMWAQLNKESARRVNEAGEAFANHAAEYFVRFETPVAELWRVEDSGILYSVTAVITTRVRGMKTLICERVNE